MKKLRCLNKIINNQVGVDITSSYKRASNILDSEMKNGKIDITNTTDPGIFKSDFEKKFIKKLVRLKDIIQILMMMKITNNHYQC